MKPKKPKVNIPKDKVKLICNRCGMSKKRYVLEGGSCYEGKRHTFYEQPSAESKEEKSKSECCGAECDALENCTKCGKFRWLNTEESSGVVVIKSGEKKVFSGESFTLEQNGEDLIATPQKAEEKNPEKETRDRIMNMAMDNAQLSVMPIYNPPAQDKWEEEFDEMFVVEDTSGRPWIGDNQEYPKQIKSFIRQQIKKAREEGYKKRDWEMEEEKEVDRATKAHKTKEGYCCACGYDLAVFETKINEVRQAEWQRIRKEVEKIETTKAITTLDGGNIAIDSPNTQVGTIIGQRVLKEKVLTLLSEEKK